MVRCRCTPGGPIIPIWSTHYKNRPLLLGPFPDEADRFEIKDIFTATLNLIDSTCSNQQDRVDKALLKLLEVVDKRTDPLL